MARKRMLSPDFWRDEKIAQCSFMERLLFQGLWTFAEDNGVGRANPLLIKADVFPYETLREADIQRSLDKLSSLKLITLYKVNGQQYYFVNNFEKHQTISRPSACTLPTLDEADEEEPDEIANTHAKTLSTHAKTLSTHVKTLSAHEKCIPKLSKDKLSKDKLSKYNCACARIPPNLEDVKNYCSERKNNVDAERFVDYYTSKGWMIGKNKMKDWKAAVRTWERNKTETKNSSVFDDSEHMMQIFTEDEP